VHDLSGEVKKFSGEVQNDLRGGVHLPSKSGHEIGGQPAVIRERNNMLHKSFIIFYFIL
jgi:hypothetical protein